jgi:hypothetical protein
MKGSGLRRSLFAFSGTILVTDDEFVPEIEAAPASKKSGIIRFNGFISIF